MFPYIRNGRKFGQRKILNEFHMIPDLDDGRHFYRAESLMEIARLTKNLQGNKIIKKIGRSASCCRPKIEL